MVGASCPCLALQCPCCINTIEIQTKRLPSSSSHGQPCGHLDGTLPSVPTTLSGLQPTALAGRAHCFCSFVYILFCLCDVM